MARVTPLRFRTMANNLKSFFGAAPYHRGVTALKKLWYKGKGEPICYGEHKLRYVPGTRPVRLKYVESPDATVRNDVKQIMFFLDKMKPGNFVLDIGGHVGQYAVLFGSLVTASGKVISFEPNETSREVLRKNVELNGFEGWVDIESIALSDRSGQQTFFSRKNDAMSSLARSGFGEGASSGDIYEQYIETTRLDEYLAGRGLGAPDWIKLDTEGAEINILRAARNILKAGTNVICELHPYAWKEFDTNFEELLEIVKECGRTIRYLDESLNIGDGPVYGATIIT